MTMTFPATNDVVEQFKNVFRAHPAGVAIITAAGGDGDGAPAGLTASSVSSVSAQPPILAFSLASEIGSAGVVAQADTLVVHLLDAGHADLASRFARPGRERFTEDLQWSRLPTGEPLLAGIPRALRCRILSRTPVGSSVLIAASVLEIVGDSSASEPLVYHNRTYHRLNGDSAIS